MSNTGHGHVYPREDGMKARCGGPGLCNECSKDQVRKNNEENHVTPLVTPRTDIRPAVFQWAAKEADINVATIKQVWVGARDGDLWVFAETSDNDELVVKYPGDTIEDFAALIETILPQT